MGQCRVCMDSGLWTGLDWTAVSSVYSLFYSKFRERVCQGGRGRLKTCDGAIPSPPFDLSDPGIRSRSSNLVHM